MRDAGVEAVVVPAIDALLADLPGRDQLGEVTGGSTTGRPCRDRRAGYRPRQRRVRRAGRGGARVVDFGCHHSFPLSLSAFPSGAFLKASSRPESSLTCCSSSWFRFSTAASRSTSA